MAVIVQYSTLTTPNPVTVYLTSVNTPDYSGQPNTLVNPDLSQVIGQLQKYWKVVGGAVQLMSASERAAVDTAQAALDYTAAKTSADSAIDGLNGYQLRAIVMVAMNEINILRENWMSFKAQVALSTNLANLQTRVAALPDTPDRTLAQAKTAYKNLVDGTSLDE